MYKLAPSLLAANFAILGQQIKQIENAGAHYIHLDVMDGMFVPNISFGIPVIKSLRKTTPMTFDVHLMIAKPERYVEAFVNAGADIINVHVEACDDLKDTIRLIKNLNKRAAVTIKPSTPPETVFDVLGDVEMVLVMSVEPGFGAQGFIPETLKNAEKLATYIANNKLLVDIEMDGGIYLNNVTEALDAGVNVVVAGTAVFGAENPGEAVREFYSVFKEYGAKK